MEHITLQQAVADCFQIRTEKVHRFLLRRSLSNRMRLLYPVVHLIHPDFLFNEIRLVEKVCGATRLREVQEEIDFYHHKYVVNSFAKNAMRLRLSGMRLMSLANKAFNHARHAARSGPPQKPLKS